GAHGYRVRCSTTGSSGDCGCCRSPRLTASASDTPVWYIVGELTADTPSFWNAVQFRIATLVYTSGPWTPYASASFCFAGRSGTRSGTNMFQQAITQARPRT